MERECIYLSLFLFSAEAIISVNVAKRGPNQNWGLCLLDSLQTATGNPKDFQPRMKNKWKQKQDTRPVLHSKSVDS